MDVTLFEVDLPDLPFDVPISDTTASTQDEAGTSEGSDSSLRPLVAVGVLVGLALLARYLRRSEAESSEEGTRDRFA